MQQLNSIVVRLHSPTGRFRIQLAHNALISTLYELTAKELGCSTNTVSIYLDESYTQPIQCRDDKNLHHYNIEHGHMLYIKSDELSFKEEKMDDIISSNQTKQKTGSSSSSSSQKDGQGSGSCDKDKETTNEPKFQSFDNFLQERKFSTVDLPLLHSYCEHQIEIGKINTLPPAVTLKHQQYRHIDHVEFMNVEEMNNFVKYWRDDLEMMEQRAGWLIGHYVEDSHYKFGIRAVVEGIYEPPQSCPDSNIICLDNDPFYDSVKQLTSALQLHIIGYIFTHFPRDELLTSNEVIRIAKFQLESLKDAPKHYTGYPVSPFVTVTIHPSSEDRGVVTNAFMVSDLGMALVRDNALSEIQDNPNRIKLRKPNKELLPEILESSKIVKEFDPDWLIVRLNDSAPIKVSSVFKSWSFPVENRRYVRRISDIKNHLRQCQSNKDLAAFADLHFIIYLAQVFDLETAQTVCHAVVNNTSIDPSLVETLRTIDV